jgi:hypothetical protein
MSDDEIIQQRVSGQSVPAVTRTLAALRPRVGAAPEGDVQSGALCAKITSSRFRVRFCMRPVTLGRSRRLSCSPHDRGIWQSALFEFGTGFSTPETGAQKGT